MPTPLILFLALLAPLTAASCGEGESRDALSVQLYSPGDLGLPETFPGIRELEILVYDRERGAVLERTTTAATSQGGQQLLSDISLGDEIQLLFTARDRDGNIAATGGSRPFAISADPDAGITRLAIYLVPTLGFAEAQAFFAGPGGIAVEASPFDDGRPRAGHSATLLPDGRVLITGGAELADPGLDGTSVATVHDQILTYDPNTGYFDVASNGLGPITLTAPRAYHTATALPDGRVLITGGLSSDGQSLTSLRSTEIIELLPDGRLSVLSLPPMAIPRYDHTATLRADGSVLVAGGRARDGGGTSTHSSAELYLPNDRSFVATRSMNTPRAQHSATLLDGAGVLITGGTDGAQALDSTELFTLNSQSEAVFIPTTTMSTPRRAHSVALLPQDGGERYLLIAGGYTDTTNLRAADTFDILDTDDGRLLPAQRLLTPRAQGLLLCLPDGALVFAGGVASDGTVAAATSDAELLEPRDADPLTFDVRQLSSNLSLPRFDARATPLDNGHVLITGGASLRAGVPTTHTTSDLFNPGLPTFAR